jgi:hypothetical protein
MIEFPELIPGCEIGSVMFRVAKPSDFETFLLIRILLNSAADFEHFLLIFTFFGRFNFSDFLKQ